MNENWTDAERLAAEVLASGSDEALRELLVELDRGRPPLGRAGRSGRSDRKRRSRPSSPAPSWLSAGWRDSGLLNSIVDAAVIVGAIASIIIGTRPLLTAVYDARPAVAEALKGITIPSVPNLEPVDATSTITAADRPVMSVEPISILARNLEATVGRYRSVAADARRPEAALLAAQAELRGGGGRVDPL